MTISTPITLTDAAASHIQSLLADNANSVGFRLSIKKTGCSGYAYVPSILEQSNEKDIYFMAQNGLKVYLDTAYLDLLQGIVVDYVSDTTSGISQKRLVYINPQEKNRCGCGESFTIE